jgi:hypothetical protein
MLIHARHQGGYKRKAICGLWLGNGIVDLWEADGVTCPECRAIINSWSEE